MEVHDVGAAIICAENVLMAIAPEAHKGDNGFSAQIISERFHVSQVRARL